MTKFVRRITAMLSCCLFLFAVGCSSTQPSQSSTSPSETETTASTPPPPPEPEYLNPLTGLEMDPSFEGQRPVAIMINNIQKATPQIGISQADIIYECTVEGGITRLMMLAKDYKSLDIIGSVRSSRNYFIDLAQGHDALYVHAGGSDDAYEAIYSRDIDNMDGVNQSIPDMFYRDPERRKKMGMEHSLMTTGEGIVGGIAYRGLRTELENGYERTLTFAKAATAPAGESALHATVPYSTYITATFDYDEASQSYLKGQYDQPHIDGATGEQLAFTNVLILRAPHTGALDAKGHIDVDLTTGGEGYFLSMGKYVPITWKKPTHESPLQLFHTSGQPLALNPGKSYISIVPTTANVVIE